VELDEQWIRETWAAQLADADLVEESTVLFVVSDEHDLDNVEMAYLPPNGHHLPYEVLRRVGEGRLHEYSGLHRFASFQTVRNGALTGFAAMLRHELRHAEQFHRYGSGLFELDGHLRAALDVHTRAAERDRYETVPIEYDANRVAASYVSDHHPEDQDALAADERFAVYARDYDSRADDLLGATLKAVNEHVDLSSLWNGQPVSVDIADQHKRAQDHAARDRTADRYNHTRGNRPGVVLI